MATMVKEKRKDKKKMKDKNKSERTIMPELLPSDTPPGAIAGTSTTVHNILDDETQTTLVMQNSDEIPEDEEVAFNKTTKTVDVKDKTEDFVLLGSSNISSSKDIMLKLSNEIEKDTSSQTNTILHKESGNEMILQSEKQKLLIDYVGDNYSDLNKRLLNITVPKTENVINGAKDLENPVAFLSIKDDNIGECGSSVKDQILGVFNEKPQADIQSTERVVQEDVMPSAPIFEDLQISLQYEHLQEITPIPRDKMMCMSLEEAVKIFGGKEMEEIRVISEKEEAIVEEGPSSGPEHPLVDLLSTFRSSLIAVERECISLTQAYADQEKSFPKLWRIETRYISESRKCGCGANVDFRATYEHAELLREKLPVAKLKLESLQRDIRDSYCHHQHEALLTHCQIDELISDTVQSSKADIREVLSLILQALRNSDGAPKLLADALERWAAALASALVDKRDIRQLLFLVHHLFRQTRSVQWAVGVVNLSVEDSVAAAQIVALLDILLARSKLDTAMECTEDSEEVWEEVDRHGYGGAVSEGVLRERDLLAILSAFPLRDLMARLVLFTNADIKQAREHEWGDLHGGRGVLKACCGVRVLLATLQRAAILHAQYTRLLHALREIASRFLLALSCLNLHSSSRNVYTKEMQIKISAELEAAFIHGFILFGTEDIHKLPATLLTDESAREYCNTFISGLHEKSTRSIETLSVEMPMVQCDMRVRIVAQAAIDRTYDHELAKIVLEFLFHGIKRQNIPCKGRCDAAMRDWMPKLLAAHPYLHTLALHMVAEINQVELIDPANLKTLSVEIWRPTTGEIRAVLEDWSQRATQLMQYLLLCLDYTPYTGLPLDVQLTIGSFLCTYVRSSSNANQEWYWEVVRKLRVHRSWWKLPLDAPPPEDEPSDSFTTAYTLLATSWGHCMPLICSQGVSALCTLASVRVRDAIHCLAPIMIVMAHSPESVSLTPKFTELFTVILNSGPSLVQRALGHGGFTGSMLLLQLILKQLENEACFDLRPGSILSAWMHALWRYSLPNSSSAVLDTAALACRDWPRLDAHATLLLQEEQSKENDTQSVRNASTAPLLCECMLRACHASKECHFYGRLLAALAQQRTKGQKIHVDNALQQIGANVNAEELVIYRSAVAAMAAPFHHPSHLALWRLFMHLYLQRPPDCLSDSAPVVGPLFFSGIIKSRTMNQIKKRLQDTAMYHYNLVESLKSEQNVETVAKSTGSANKSSKKADNGMLLALSINDLTGQSSESSSGSESSGEDNECDSRSAKEQTDDPRKISSNLVLYHRAAEKLIRQYLLWLEEGENVKAHPHEADIARFIPQQPLEVSWRHALSISRPSIEVDCETPTTPTILFPQPLSAETPFRIAVNTITGIKDRSRKRTRRRIVKSPLEDVYFNDSKTLTSIVLKHLQNIEKLAKEWCDEVSKTSSLDAQLWEAVCSLRVRRPLPAIKKQCPNKCKPITLQLTQDEWCLSTSAESRIKENRFNSRCCIRRLTRPRPHAARTVAALHTIARRVNNSDAARRVVELAWECAGACGTCALAHDAIATFVTYLVERWICHEGRLCSNLLCHWSKNTKNPLQQSLCGAIVSPQRLPLDRWSLVYVALLRAHLPNHMLFSYLSKFDMTRWSVTADPKDRREVLEELLITVRRWGPNPDTQHHVLLDLLNMHTLAVVNEAELCAHVLNCSKATVCATLPMRYWTHVPVAIERVAGGIPFDQIGHLLRQLGVMWWEARTGIRGKNSPNFYGSYSPYIARLLNVLLRAFVVAAIKLSIAPERVGLYAWSAIQESWGAWILPSVAVPPLLPPLVEEEAFTPMMRHFVDTLYQVMLDCPGVEITLLRHAFEWTIQTYQSVQSLQASQETRVQMSTLLVEMAKLPWIENQWCYGKCLQVIMQICTSNDREITSWCCQTWRNITAETWLREDGDSDQEQLAPKLASLLYLYTGTHMPHEQKTLEEATRLPWWRLPELALGEAMDRFFVTHHNPAVPYHELPQYNVILFASELYIHPHTPNQYRTSGNSRQKRCVAVSQFVRAACAPTLRSHVTGHCKTLLNVLTQLASCLESASDEIEELLGRAIQIMCMESAAIALPVWESWVCNTSTRMVQACVSASSVLTAFEYFAAIADTAVKTLLNKKECGGWDEVVSRLGGSPWREPDALLARGRLHAAYACAVAHAQAQHANDFRRTLSELRAANINFVENEAIVALWICQATRTAMACSGDAADLVTCANQLVAGWGNPPRRSILRVVAMQADNDRPTSNHRLICRLAQCVLNPNDVNLANNFESACTGPLSGISSWGRNPTLERLVRLAVTLYPQYERYFKIESEIVSRE